MVLLKARHPQKSVWQMMDLFSLLSDILLVSYLSFLTRGTIAFKKLTKNSLFKITKLLIF
jgi:hypothetical protein